MILFSEKDCFLTRNMKLEDTFNINIQSNDDYVLAKYKGPDSPEISRAIMQRIIDACEEYQCFRILVLAYLNNSLSTTENYDLSTMFKEVGFSSKHRMAWVDINPDTRKSTGIAETFLYSQYFKVGLFHDEMDAKYWLQYGPDD